MVWAWRCSSTTPVAAVLASSLLFGFWHILPSLVMHDANAAVGDLLGGGIWGRIQSVLLTVAGTAVAGVVFCALRDHSGALMALHWAINGWVSSRELGAPGGPGGSELPGSRTPRTNPQHASRIRERSDVECSRMPELLTDLREDARPPGPNRRTTRRTPRRILCQ